MKFNKSILLFIILPILLSCNNSNDKFTTITFWAMGAEGEALKKLTPEFEKKNTSIKVKIQQVPWTAAQEKLITAFASDNTPDGCQLGNTWIPQFAAINAIEELDSLLETYTSIKKENYFSGIWKTNIIDSAVYGIPWYLDTRLLYYRTDILAEAGYGSPPKTWTELYDASKKIKKLENDPNKFAIFIPTNEWSPYVIFGLQAGASLLKDNNTYGNFSSPEFSKAFNFLINFHKESLSPVGITQVTNVYQAFAEGYFAMYISGPWHIPEFKKWMDGDLKNKWMTSAMPAADNSYPGVSLAGGSSLVIFKNSKNKDAIWKYYEFLSSEKVQIEFYKILNDLPSLKIAWQDSILLNDKYMKAFYTQFQNVEPTPKIPEWEQIASSKIQQYVEIAARGKMTTKQALSALDDDVNLILEKRRWLLGRN